MDGSTVLTDLITSSPVQVFNQAKFVVRVAFSPDGRWLATASYDRTINVYENTHAPLLGVRADEYHAVAEEVGEEVPIIDREDDPELACEPGLGYVLRHTVKTEGNPEALLFHPRSEWVIWTERGGFEMKYLRLPSAPIAGEDVAMDGAEGDGVKPWDTCSKSFNAHPGDTHVSFSVLDMALHPSGRMIACVTGDHASGGERVLVYGTELDEVSFASGDCCLRSPSSATGPPRQVPRDRSSATGSPRQGTVLQRVRTLTPDATPGQRLHRLRERCVRPPPRRVDWRRHGCRDFYTWRRTRAQFSGRKGWDKAQDPRPR